MIIVKSLAAYSVQRCATDGCVKTIKAVPFNIFIIFEV